MDVGSTKRDIAEMATQLGIAARFVGCHPLTGDHRSGWEAARSGMFSGATVFLCPSSETAPDALTAATAFWSARVRSVLTLETDADWARTLAGDKLANVEIRATTPQRIDADMAALGRSFDAVIVDASASRYRCAKAALALLKPGGFILLDNSDWYPNTSAMLRQADLIQVDFPDFRPLRWYRCVSSLFLHKDFRPKPRLGALPLPPMGNVIVPPMGTF